MNPAKKQKTISRTTCDILDKSEAFRIHTARIFKPQYAQLYHERLTMLYKLVRETAEAKWGSKYPLRSLSDLVEDETACLIGTLYKEMAMKPNILREVCEDTEVPAQEIKERYAMEGDTLVLEDEAQRITVQGKIDLKRIVTGIVVALVGRENSVGSFVVEDFTFIGMPKQSPFVLPETDCYVAFLSGLGLGSNNKNSFPVDLCIDLLTGQAGDEKQRRKMATVCAVVIAGDLIEADVEERKQHALKARYLTRHTSLGSVDKMKNVDETLEQLVHNIDVYVMPGSNDPGNFMLPQQPLHPCMFPLCFKSSGLHLVTNPFQFDINGIRILGTSGQNATDIYKNCFLDDPLDILEQTLHWAHIAPTAPDTLGCYPFVDADPFILDETPCVYFAGNQLRKGCRQITGPKGQQVTLLSVDKFCDHPSIVLLNLRNLKVEFVTLDCELGKH